MSHYFCLIIGRKRMLPDGVNWDWAAGTLKLERWRLYRYVFQPHPRAANWKWKRCFAKPVGAKP